MKPCPRSLVIALCALFAAACSPASSTGPSLAVSDPPNGWGLVGRIQGEGSSGPLVARYTFSGRQTAVGVACRGSGTVFVIIGWSDISPLSGPATFETSAFPCSASKDTNFANRIELGTGPTGEADVRVFVVEPTGSAGTSYNASIEERQADS